MMKRLAKAGRAFTLVEMLISITAFALVGGIIFEILRLGLILHTKNIAINVAHQQARMAMDRISGDISTAISVPTVTDTNFNASALNTAGAGVEFLQLRPSNPVLELYTPQTLTAASTQVIVSSGTTGAPMAGEWLVVPACGIQQSISTVSGANGTYTLALSSSIYSTIGLSGTTSLALSGSTNVVAMIADQVGYKFSNGQLLYYPHAGSTSGTLSSIYSVIARNLVSTNSYFAVPATNTGTGN